VTVETAIAATLAHSKCVKRANSGLPNAINKVIVDVAHTLRANVTTDSVNVSTNGILQRK
jgi:hypothetical protein